MRTAFLVAAPFSGSGKTTVCRALMRLYARQGMAVQPFKCGPDYIDTKFHSDVCGRPSVNLDTFMADAGHVRRLFHRYSHDADAVIVEGMMGLFDGYDRDRGSCAEIARVLALPVVLVADAHSTAYSMAAMLQGFAGFRSDVHVAGVIFNNVGSPRHERILRQTCADLGLPCFGCLPRNTRLATRQRYLGLDFSELTDADMLADFIEEHVALPDFKFTPTTSDTTSSFSPTKKLHKTFVARSSESFSFIYRETLDAMGDVTFFNPESDVPPLDHCDLLYLPGGYPEKHLEALAGAEATRMAIRHYAERGGRIIAECGGMMYLCRSIIADADSSSHSPSREYPMCGVLPVSITARKADRHLSLGYRQFTLDGRTYRGHEFHYSQFCQPVPPSACQVYDALGQAVPTPVIRYKNVLASYTHLYLNEKNLY